MKNVLVYTSFKHSFDKEHEILAKIQIDNILDLGGTRDDILIFTNFEFEYDGVTSTVIPDVFTVIKHGEDRRYDPTSHKIPVVMYLIENKLIDEDQLYWCHDFDCYQNYTFTEEDIDMGGLAFGAAMYGYKPEWQLGGFFFTTKALDMLKTLYTGIESCRYFGRVDEKKFTSLVKSGGIDRNLIKELNVTYNFTALYQQLTYPVAEKPIKVVHFHPWQNVGTEQSGTDIFIHGKNKAGIPLASDRLIKIFNKHGIK